MKRMISAVAVTLFLALSVFAGEIPSDGFAGDPPGTNQPNATVQGNSIVDPTKPVLCGDVLTIEIDMIALVHSLFI